MLAWTCLSPGVPLEDKPAHQLTLPHAGREELADAKSGPDASSFEIGILEQHCVVNRIHFANVVSDP